MSIKRDGILKTFIKVIVRPYEFLKEKYALKRYSLIPIEDRFTSIYNSNKWGSKESLSGSGSTLKYTENLRHELPNLVDEFAIKKIFDAPCGDFNWMSHLLPMINVDYIGGDIVKPLIDSLKDKYGNEKVSFIHINLINQAFCSADLMICRDCLFHLSYKDTKSLLQNFLDANIPYLLTTTHVNNGSFINKDIQTGNFRLIDLFSSPYNFSNNPLYVIDDWIEPDPERKMCLWSRNQVSEMISNLIN